MLPVHAGGRASRPAGSRHPRRCSPGATRNWSVLSSSTSADATRRVPPAYARPADGGGGAGAVRTAAAGGGGGGGYLPQDGGGGGGGWTWDDDYNPAVIAQTQRAASEPPLSPRLLRRQQRDASPSSSSSPSPSSSPSSSPPATPIVITRLPEHLSRSTLANAVVLVDKPQGWTSFDCVKALRWALKVRKAGHTATLDAPATGLVVVLLGAATALTARFSPLPKEYSGVIRLGEATNTFDASGKVTEEMSWLHVTDEALQAAAAGFVGEISQVPPMWSSVKVQGRPLRWYAERGQTVPRQPQPVYVESFEVWREPGSRDVQFTARVAKGAFMRVLAHDFGAALRTRAHLAALRREAIGGFRAASAWDLGTLLPLARKLRKGARDLGVAPPPPGLLSGLGVLGEEEYGQGEV